MRSLIVVAISIASVFSDCDPGVGQCKNPVKTKDNIMLQIDKKQPGKALKDKVGDKFKDTRKDKVGDKFKDKMKDKVGDKVKDKMKEKVGDKVKGKKNKKSDVLKAIRDECFEPKDAAALKLKIAQCVAGKAAGCDEAGVKEMVKSKLEACGIADKIKAKLQDGIAACKAELSLTEIGPDGLEAPDLPRGKGRREGRGQAGGEGKGVKTGSVCKRLIQKVQQTFTTVCVDPGAETPAVVKAGIRGCLSKLKGKEGQCDIDDLTTKLRGAFDTCGFAEKVKAKAKEAIGEALAAKKAERLLLSQRDQEEGPFDSGKKMQKAADKAAKKVAKAAKDAAGKAADAAGDASSAAKKAAEKASREAAKSAKAAGGAKSISKASKSIGKAFGGRRRRRRKIFR